MSTAREMANWVFLWDDAITEIASVDIQSHTTEVAGYVAENLLDGDRQTCFKGTAVSPDDIIIEFDLQGDVVLKGFALLGHNAGTIGVDSLSVNYHTQAEGPTASHQWFSSTISSAVGDDDFFIVPASSVTARYIRVFLHNPDSSGAYMGRTFLAREAYELPNFVQTGATKGFSHSEEVLLTKGGIEHRNSRGNVRRRLTAVMPSESSSTPRDNMIALIEHVQLNHKAFVMSSPYGTNVYSQSGGTLYGAAIHARFNLDDWQYSMLAAGTTQVPLDIIEDL